ncbi:MAG TPA: hypothetical protein VFE65_02370 [Pseudonocardia sp.]|jgi:spore maturation protein SpmB|nr:hypothetical protein [Pseudonocardia sp.]
MNTLLYGVQIVVGVAVMAAGLAGSTRRPANAARSTSVTRYADVQVAGVNGLIGALLGAATVALGVTGLAGSTEVPVALAFLITAGGLMSVVLTLDTSTPVDAIETEAFAVAERSRTATVMSLPAVSLPAVSLAARDRTHEGAASRAA